MTEGVSLEKVERKAWASYFEDGLWDIFLGAMLLIGGIRSVTDYVWYTLLILPLILVLPVGKRLITTPRLGYAKFGPSRKTKQEKAVVALIISVLAVFALLLLPNLGLALPPKTLISPMMAIWIAVMFGILATWISGASSRMACCLRHPKSYRDYSADTLAQWHRRFPELRFC
jgi:hypothetical protein